MRSIIEHIGVQQIIYKIHSIRVCGGGRAGGSRIEGKREAGVGEEGRR